MNKVILVQFAYDNLFRGGYRILFDLVKVVYANISSGKLLPIIVERQRKSKGYGRPSEVPPL